MTNTKIKLLPCSYADSEEMILWLDAMSVLGYQATKITNIYAKFIKQKTNERYYHMHINSVTEQYEFSHNGASSKGNIIQKQKDRGFEYVGKCGSYLFFRTKDIKLIQQFDTIEHHTDAIKLTLQTQIILTIISLICGWQMLKIWYVASYTILPLLKYSGFALIFFLPVYALVQLCSLFKKSRHQDSYIPPYKKTPEVRSAFPETLFRITILFIASAVIVFSVL